MIVSEELERTLQRARRRAIDGRHEFVTLEHLLYALVDDSAAAEALVACGIERDELRAAVDRYLLEELPPLEQVVEPEPTIGVRSVLEIASRHVQSAGREELNGANVLVALFRASEEPAVWFLERRGLRRLDVVRYLSHGVQEPASSSDPYGDGDGPAAGQDDEAEDGAPFDPLRRWCIDLNARADEGRIDPLIGRAAEVERTIQILARRRKNNPIFVGEAGVGKTAIVEGLARRIQAGEAPEALQGARIYALDMGALLAGTKFRGEFEERLKRVVEAFSDREDRILFIDEIHTLVGAGAASGGSLDASNLLKPALANGSVRCIGTTTYVEYRNIFEKDHALSRRFQRIEVAEPSEAETRAILEGLRGRYEAFHGVRYARPALDAAVELSARHIRGRFLPDKAIDVLDEAGARVKLRSQAAHPMVRAADIEAVVAGMAKVPPRTVRRDDRERLATLADDLRLRIFGQNEAVDQVVQAIRMARAGLADPTRPIGSFLFAGPTGVGKTELARQLAEALGIAFIRFDMSEYMEKHTVSRLIGSPPGYVGFDQGGQLTEAILREPHAVLLLDEIEKAHEDLFNVLLQVMDYATLTDNSGRKADFRQVILVMTTNSGAFEAAQRPVGFEAGDAAPHRAGKAIECTFTPEFRNRLTATVHFAPLGRPQVERVVEKMIAELQTRLADRQVRIELDPTARRWLAETGYDPAFGARPIRRLIEQQIARPLAEQLLFGKLARGGSVRIRLRKGQLAFDISGPDA